MSYSVANDIPGLRYKAAVSRSWASTGNTDTVSDPSVHSNSVVVITVTGATASAGRWAVAVSEGSFTVTSSDVENAGLTYTYHIL